MRCPACILGDAAIAPMNGDTNLVCFLAIDHHRFDPPRDHRLGDIYAASAAYLYLLASLDSQFAGWRKATALRSLGLTKPHKPAVLRSPCDSRPSPSSVYFSEPLFSGVRRRIFPFDIQRCAPRARHGRH
jgi:hypothetical protein